MLKKNKILNYKDLKNLKTKNKNKTVDIRSYRQDSKRLIYDDNSFDLVISTTTIHNLDLADCKQALKEIERVSRKNKFITVDAYSNEEERKLIYSWNLTAKTILHTDEWKKVFKKTSYTGDFYWFKP